MWTVQKQADAKVALCSLLSPESASYQILSPVATNCHSYQFFADTNLPLLPESLSAATKTVQDTSFSLLLVFPCYQTFAAVLDSPGSAPVTQSSLSLLLNCPRYQFFAATSLPLLPDFRRCPGQPRICPCYQILSQLATKLSTYQFFAATSLSLLPDFCCCPRQWGICPCYQILSPATKVPRSQTISFSPRFVQTSKKNFCVTQHFFKG